MYFVAYKLLENAADAEDLVQEAYLKLWVKREGLTVINNSEAFSVTLVKNMYFDLLRSSKYILNRQTVELNAVHDIQPVDNLELRDEARQIRHIITQLLEQRQRIVTLWKHDVCPPTPEDTFSDPQDPGCLRSASSYSVGSFCELE